MSSAVVSLTVILASQAVFIASQVVAPACAKDDWEEDPAPNAQVETKDGKTVLKLGVEHSSSLSAIPDSLQAGSLFNDKLLNEGSDKLIWYRIPKWLAGQWRRGMETTVFTQDYQSGYTDRNQRTFMSEQVADFGVQQDRSGGIWNCNLSSRGVSDRGSYRSIALVQTKEPVVSTDKEVIFREVFTVLNVQKQSNLITDSFMIESLTRHRPRPDGSLDTVMSVKIYNAGGTPRQVQENIAHERRVSPLVVVDNYKGRDIKANFIDFLREKNMSELIPK